MTDQEALDFRAIWQDAIPFQQFARDAEQNKNLWDGVYRTTKVPQWARDRVCEGGDRHMLLVIAEDWCGDASNTVPVFAKLGDEAGCFEVRVIKRDENLDIMDRYLSQGARSIPIAILLDGEFSELGHWGPRPTELQQWVMDNKDQIPKQDLYPQVRRWYAKDKGESTMRELLDLL